MPPTIATAASTSTQKSPPKFEGNVPAMNSIDWWETLKKLGWSKPSGSDYRVVDLKTEVPIVTTDSPDLFMLKNGIPNVEQLKKLDAGIQQQLDAQIKRSCIDATLLTKARDGRDGLSYEIPTGERIQEILQNIGFKHSQCSEGKQVWSSPSNKESFDSLEQVRVFARKEGNNISRPRIPRKQVLLLQLWAASSPEPLPTFDLKRYQEQHGSYNSSTTPPSLDDCGKNNDETCSSESSKRGRSDSEYTYETDSSDDNDPPTKQRRVLRVLKTKKNPPAGSAPGHAAAAEHVQLQAIAKQGQTEGVGLTAASHVDSQQQPTPDSALGKANDVTPDKKDDNKQKEDEQDVEEDQTEYEDMTVKEIFDLAVDWRNKTVELLQDIDSTQRKAVSGINNLITEISIAQTELLELNNYAGIFQTAIPDDDLNHGDNNPLNNIVHSSGIEWEEINTYEVQFKNQLQRLRQALANRKRTAIRLVEDGRKAFLRVKRKSEHPFALVVKERDSEEELDL